jgi:hypothetical protein
MKEDIDVHVSSKRFRPFSEFISTINHGDSVFLFSGKPAGGGIDRFLEIHFDVRILTGQKYLPGNLA